MTDSANIPIPTAVHVVQSADADHLKTGTKNIFHAAGRYEISSVYGLALCFCRLNCV
jgi:hypothetical protein